MRFTSLVLGALLMPLVSSAQTGLTTLTDLRDHARPLLIFAGKPDDPQLEIQIRTLQENAAQTEERQIVPVAIVYNNPSPTEAKLDTAEAEAVRRRFQIAPSQFAVILLGKDGGEKLRSSKPLPIGRLTSTVDSMPMRQEEMKHGQR